MTAVISLRAVADALEEQDDQCGAYLNPESGEILTVSHEEDRMLEEGYDEESLPQWQVDTLNRVREFQQNTVLPLPNTFDIHEWQIMDNFAGEQEKDGTRTILCQALHGSGAFRCFKNAIYQLGIEEAWFRFRRKALEDIAREWLEEHHLPYN